jgi:hypothetical protein
MTVALVVSPAGNPGLQPRLDRVGCELATGDLYELFDETFQDIMIQTQTNQPTCRQA